MQIRCLATFAEAPDSCVRFSVASDFNSWAVGVVLISVVARCGEAVGARFGRIRDASPRLRPTVWVDEGTAFAQPTLQARATVDGLR